jgi:hypothetical protein
MALGSAINLKNGSHYNRINIFLLLYIKIYTWMSDGDLDYLNGNVLNERHIHNNI